MPNSQSKAFTFGGKLLVLLGLEAQPIHVVRLVVDILGIAERDSVSLHALGLGHRPKLKFAC
jgi:hypothetical protein